MPERAHQDLLLRPIAVASLQADQEGDEEASADPDVKDRRVAKLGDVATDPVVQHEHVENGEEGEGASGIDGHDREV